MPNQQPKISATPKELEQIDFQECAAAAAGGDLEATTRLGVFYLKGGPVLQDVEKGKELLEKARGQGNGEASYHLGMSLVYPDFTATPDALRAMAFFQEAAERGVVDALVRMTQLLDDTPESARLRAGDFAADPARSLAYLEEADRKGSAEAAFRVAEHALRKSYNHPVKIFLVGAHHFARALARGYKEAAGELAKLTQACCQSVGANTLKVPSVAPAGPNVRTDAEHIGRAMGVSPDAVLNVGGLGERLRTLAAGGEPEHQFACGLFYEGDLVGKPDYAEARRWFEKAAAKGHGLALAHLASLYHRGDGVPAPDVKRAVALWKESAKQGIPLARARLACEFLRSEPQLRAEMGLDLQQAVRWLEEAAATGLPFAQRVLAGLLIEDARGYLEEGTLNVVVGQTMQSATWLAGAVLAGEDGPAEELADFTKEVLDGWPTLLAAHFQTCN